MMSLEDDLKAKALALISQQMANWVVDIQRQIQEHQGTFVKTLDELSEAVARYDEKINEGEIAAAMAEVVAAQPPPLPPPPVFAGPGMDKLRLSIAEIEKGTSLSEVLTYLVNEVSQYVDRTAMFIVKGTSAIGWYSRGVDPGDAVKQVNVPLAADTVFRNVSNSRQALRGALLHTPGTAQAIARLGGRPQSVLVVPLILRDKLAAILYCDSTKDEVPGPEAHLVEVLVLFAAKSIDLLSLMPKTAPAAAARTSVGTTPERAAAIRAGGDDIRERAGVPRPAAPPPPVAEEGSSTVMFKAGTFTPQKAPVLAPPPAPAPAAPVRPAPVPAAAPAAPAAPIAPEDQKAHEDAKRFARLVVSEIKLYNEAKVNEGRRQKDLYERLKEDVERGRQMYAERVPSRIRDTTNYFFDELVRILAGGDASALGAM
jgi:hypothetical protein